MVLFVALGIAAIIFGLLVFLRLAMLLLKWLCYVIFLNVFASEKTINKTYERHILMKSDEYKQQSKAVDQTINSILK